jgi:hypothetical protein
MIFFEDYDKIKSYSEKNRIMYSLVEQYCPHIHEASISATVFEPYGQIKAVADQNGLVAVFRGSDVRPFLTVQMDDCVNNSLALTPQGSLLAIGDNQGNIKLIDLKTQHPVFEESRAGQRGRSRAFRSLSLSPTGSKLAAISIDGILRVWDLITGKRQNFRGFGGSSLEFDARGDRLLLIGQDNQPKLFDLPRSEVIPLAKATTLVEHASFSRDGTFIFAAGPGGFIVFQMSTLQIINGKAAQKSSGIVSIAIHPTENKVAAFTKRSTYVMTCPELEIYDNFRHGSPNVTNTAIWDHNDIWIGGSDGILHSRQNNIGIPPTHISNGIGEFRITAHSNIVSVWQQNQRQHLFGVKEHIKEAMITRNGRFLVLNYEQTNVQVFQVHNQKMILQGPPDTQDSKKVLISPKTIAVELKRGGCYWWNFKSSSSQGMQINWARNIALTGGGNWLGVVTPEGRIQIIDTQTGRKALPDPKPNAPAEIIHIAFVNKSSTLLTVDSEGYLISYDLSTSGKDGATGKDIIQINCTVENIWGITGGQIVVAKINDGDGSKLLYLDVEEQQPPQIVTNISSETSIDPHSGNILIPAKCGAMLELKMIIQEKDFQRILPEPHEYRVLRNLPNHEWIAYQDTSILGLSSGANAYLV